MNNIAVVQLSYTPQGRLEDLHTSIYRNASAAEAEKAFSQELVHKNMLIWNSITGKA